MNTNPDQILVRAIEVKQAIDEYMLEVKVNCGWYGNKFVHMETCNCDWDYDVARDLNI